MESDALSVRLTQLPLFPPGETTTGAVELFPTVWTAAEALTSPDLQARRAGLERLVQLGAARVSPLIAYLFATRLMEPDLGLRAEVVRALADIFAPDEAGRPAPDAVRQQVNEYLAHMRTRPIYALLQLSSEDTDLEGPVATLLGVNCYAGSHLSNILLDRKAPTAIRQQAARLIGKVGYVDVLPDLERLVSRLQAKLAGQQAMPFAPVSEEDELALLPELQQAISLLRAP